MKVNVQEKNRVIVATRKCYECQGEMNASRQNYCYTECGLQSVVLMNILVFHCSTCSAIVPEIPDAGWLHYVISWDLLHKKTLLSAEEVKFVRKMAGYSATELSKVMGTTKVTVSRWENGTRQISKENDRLLRLICFARMVEQVAGETADSELAVNIARLARAYKSMNITTILEGIKNSSEGPKRVKIDPAKMAGFGESFSALNDTEPMLQ